MTGSFFFQNVISFSGAVHLMCNIFIWNWSNTINVKSAVWILMAWCFSTRASVATVLITHPCVSRCLRVNGLVPNRWQAITWTNHNLAHRWIFVWSSIIELIPSLFLYWLQFSDCTVVYVKCCHNVNIKIHFCAIKSVFLHQPSLDMSRSWNPS